MGLTQSYLDDFLRCRAASQSQTSDYKRNDCSLHSRQSSPFPSAGTIVTATTATTATTEKKSKVMC